MRTPNSQGRTNNGLAAYHALILLWAGVAFGLCGCGVVEYLRPEGPPYDFELRRNYDMIPLNTANSAYVLGMIRESDQEPLSRGTSVVASQGQKRKGRKLWFTMVAFDENTSLAIRKYLFIVNDRPNLMEEPKKDLSFDCQIVLGPEVFDTVYVNEDVRRIAILRKVQENLKRDKDEVAADNKLLDTSAMLAGQALQAVLVQLDSSPVLASGLGGTDGVDFSHLNLGTGKIQMLLQNDIVTVKLRLGEPAETWAEDLQATHKKIKGDAVPKSY